jgi:DNA-binding response OmpR family regulator
MTGNMLNSIGKILVVEDSRTQAEYLQHILENEGFRVIVAANGIEAREQIGTDPPSLILTDIVMPEMDGYTLCRLIKQNPQTARIPVILVTQLFDPVDVIRGLEAGADNFIIKPFEAGHVMTRIRSVMQALSRPDPDSTAQVPLEVSLGGETHLITSSRLRILTLLLSTYDIAVAKNAELQEAHERLNLQSDQLQQAVTDLRQANRDLQAENAERLKVEKALADANRKLQLMTSITRHDLRNQLTAVREYLELALARRAKDPERAWADVSGAMAVVNQTINTVEFTGEYQKIGVKSPAWKNARQMVDDTGKYISLGPIRLENAIPATVEVYADPLIEKVFFNLIDNAVRYGKKTTFIRFRYEENDGGGTLICEDDGVGIDGGEKEKIFAYEYGMNTGLGLFLTREVLTITGITIRETGMPGEGAKFEMKCPKGSIRIRP